MKKKILLLSILIMCAFFVLCLAACDTSSKEDNRSSTVKPDINTALANYDKLDKKRSDFTADLTYSLYKLDPANNNALTSIALTEELSLDRRESGGKIYLGGTVKTASADERLVAAYKTVMKLIQSSYDPTTDEVINYLQGDTHFGMKLGYADGVYNLKADYFAKNEEESGSFWGATNDDTVKNLADKLKLDVDVVLADYLMTSGVTDLGDINAWIDKDSAGKYFSTDSNSFYYNITANKDKLHQMIFNTIAEMVATMDKTEYKDFLDLYTQVLPYIEKWISVGPSTLDASVNYNGLPEKMETSIVVYLNIDLKELETVLKILTPDDYNEILSTVKLAYAGLSLRGTEGREKTIGMAFELRLKELFSYGDKNIHFSDLDPDLFLPIDEEKEGRDIFVWDDKDEEDENTTPPEPDANANNNTGADNANANENANGDGNNNENANGDENNNEANNAN